MISNIYNFNINTKIFKAYQSRSGERTRTSLNEYERLTRGY